MLSFTHIWETASEHKGGDDALEALLPQPSDNEALQSIPDDRYLSAFTKAVFSSGFVWRVVDNKWPAFEEVFYGFQPERILDIIPPHWEAIGEDARIIRNKQKIKTIAVNARMIVDLASEYGSMGAFIAGWPVSRITDLWTLLHKQGSRLGGNTGPFALRRLGKDTFLMTGDVTTALQRQGLIGKNPHTKRNLQAAMDAFETWRQESGRPLCQISRVLACTVATERRR